MATVCTNSCAVLVVIHLLLITLCRKFEVAEGVSPGFQFRLSKTGLNYAAGVAVDVLSEKVGQVNFPDISRSDRAPVGQVSYDVTQMRVTDFVKPATGVIINTGSGLTWQLHNAGISVSGHWRYKYKFGFISIKDSGTFTGVVSGASLTASATVGIEQSGRFTISSTGCHCHVSSVRIRLHGGASWLYNLILGNVERPIRNRLQEQMCTLARKTIDENARAQLATLPITVTIYNNWMFDYRLVSPPLFQSEYLDSFHKGEFFFKGDKTEAPYEAPAFPLSPPEEMVTIWVSDYILNTVGYVLYKRNILRHFLTKRILPQAEMGALNTTCTGIKCFGFLVPQSAVAYPGASVELEMYASSYPTASISPGHIQGNLSGIIDFRARLSNGSLVPMFKVNVSVVISFVISLKDMVLRGNITSLSSNIRVMESKIGHISATMLNCAFNLVSELFVIPKLNEAGQRGIPIPIIKNVKFSNTNLKAESHCLRISTDVVYSP